MTKYFTVHFSASNGYDCSMDINNYLERHPDYEIVSIAMCDTTWGDPQCIVAFKREVK